MSARDGWNAAQRASEREPKKPRAMLGPVGTRPGFVLADTTCPKCGFLVHAPNCPTYAPRSGPRFEPRRATSLADFSEATSERGDCEWAIEKMKLGYRVRRLGADADKWWGLSVPGTAAVLYIQGLELYRLELKCFRKRYGNCTFEAGW